MYMTLPVIFKIMWTVPLIENLKELVVNVRKCYHVEVEEGLVKMIEVEDVSNLLNRDC